MPGASTLMPAAAGTGYVVELLALACRNNSAASSTRRGVNVIAAD